MSSLLDLEMQFISFFLPYWWLWLFLVLIFLAPELWLSYVREHYKLTQLRPVLLELLIPRELRKSPKAMEQVFVAMHAIRNSASDLQDKYWDGEVTLWFSCEVVSFGGEVHFYLRVPSKHRNMLEATLYAHYSDIEIVEASQDYIYRLPPTYGGLEKAGYKMFGNELVLVKHDAYPIRTYVDFEAIEEEQQLDPISALLETLIKLKPQETLWVQILVRPKVDDSWKKEGEILVKKIKEEVGKRQVTTSLGEFVMVDRSPGELEVMKAVDRNLAKPGFDTLIRYLYFSPSESFDSNFGQRAVFSAFNQYASESLNKFRHNFKAWTRASIWFWPHLFPKRRLYARRVNIYQNYRNRKMYDETLATAILKINPFHWGIGARRASKMVLNTEELATIYHPPTNIVLTSHLIKRIESRKIGPPAGLPIYGEKGDIEFKK